RAVARAVARPAGDARARRRGHCARRPQPHPQPAVRVQRSRHVPRPRAGQPRAGRRHGRREGTPVTAAVAAPPVAAVASPYAGLPVVPARHPWRWVATAGVALLLAMVVSSLLRNEHWEWDVVAKYLTWPSVLEGLWGTLRLAATATLIGFGLGT